MKLAALALLFALLLVISPLRAAPPPAIGARIHSAITRSPVGKNAYWGIEIADVSSGTLIYRSNADHFFVPASNTKLFTTALTLSRLGRDFRIHTTITAAQPPSPDGIISGDLVLNGAGDPSLKTADIEALAAQIAELGVRQIDGAIVGDDRAFLFEPYNPGWSIDDAVEGYGAPISALTLNDNTITLHLLPAPAFDPPVPLLSVENQIEQDPFLARKVRYSRLPGSSALRLWGTLPPTDSDKPIVLGVDDPARYAALVLLDALQRRGIQVAGQAQARHRLPGGKFPPPEASTVLAQHESLPLVEDLRLTDKESQNLHAETYLRLVAQQRTGQGSRSAGLDELHAFLTEAGIEPEQYALFDGSGLSRMNEVTPHAVVTLLRFMANSQAKEDWSSLLAIGGVDGTLEKRMTARKVKARVIAKTGSLSHVSALSGYIERRHGNRFAFSILVNNYNGPSSDIRDLIDKICSLLVD